MNVPAKKYVAVVFTLCTPVVSCHLRSNISLTTAGSCMGGGDKLSGLSIQLLDCTTSTGKCFGAVRSRGFFGQICRRTYLSAPVLIKTVVFQTIFSKIVNSLIYEVSTLEDTYFHSSIFTAFNLGFEA